MNDNLQSDTPVSKDIDKSTVTRQVDLDIKDKVDRKAFQEAARLLELPKAITDLEFVFITLICQATDEGKNEIWEHEGGAYITVMLPYQFVSTHPKQEVTVRFLEVYRDIVERVVEIPHISALE